MFGNWLSSLVIIMIDQTYTMKKVNQWTILEVAGGPRKEDRKGVPPDNNGNSEQQSSTITTHQCHGGTCPYGHPGVSGCFRGQNAPTMINSADMSMTISISGILKPPSPVNSWVRLLAAWQLILPLIPKHSSNCQRILKTSQRNPNMFRWSLAFRSNPCTEPLLLSF